MLRKRVEKTMFLNVERVYVKEGSEKDDVS
ncbi:UNVERIFIED_ORG: hypothetical protein ABRZ91_000321 [Heyndrickxia coagulans]